ncbi:hypothetical protein GCM10011575_44940 [Microlunatus endophyticus]|uniref:Short chain dehydrogenase n=1 Tax=Microlunatus endophyticus TaxID=1716077 RepID=A0A917SIA3_9ACTN|nr:SDR family NAD(P)-dependent oxidoreductase [Microlunatus endophyticus]GGL81669.1 hypothetical protein GCM10011575_44940 [Microlunatus endophyticus]
MSAWFIIGASRGFGALIARTALDHGTIDVLVNNAGRGLLGPLEEATEDEVRNLFDLNVFAVINMTRAVLR